MERIKVLLMPGEKLYAVYDMKGGGTGFLGITDLRLIIMDQAFLRKKKSLVSVPFTKVIAVASEDSGKAILGSILGSSNLTIIAGAHTWEFEFRSNEKAHKAYQLIMRNLLQTEVVGM